MKVGGRMLTYSFTEGTLRSDRARVSTLSSLSFFTLRSNHSLGTWWALKVEQEMAENVMKPNHAYLLVFKSALVQKCPVKKV